MSDAIRLRGVRKTFGPKVAVEGLDLTVPVGGLYGFIGPNGAGKTTTIRMIMSILFPDDGELAVLGASSALDAKDRIGYLPEERGVYKKMPVATFLTYIARLKGLSASEAKRRGREWLERVGLADVAQKKCEELSKGMQQKIQFVASVIHDPALVILDEPFSGLDPVNMRLLRDLVLEQHRRGATVIFSTHVMQQAEQICEHIVMIHDGRKVLDESLTGIRQRFDPRAILFEPMDATADPAALAGVPGIDDVRADNGTWQIGLVDGSDPAAAMRAIVNAVAPAAIELRRPTLEDIFVDIVAGSDAASAAETERLRAALRDDATAAAS